MGAQEQGQQLFPPCKCLDMIASNGQSLQVVARLVLYDEQVLKGVKEILLKAFCPITQQCVV